MKKHMSASEVALLGLLGAAMFTLQFAMAALPNLEPVSLLVLVYAALLGKRALFPIYVFVGLSCLVWGINLWTLAYLYVWAILAGVSWLMRGMRSALGWAILSGLFGLLFGALCALIYLPMGKWQFAFTWWLQGIPFDLMHCIGNFFLTLFLYHPLKKFLGFLLSRTGWCPVTKEFD